MTETLEKRTFSKSSLLFLLHKNDFKNMEYLDLFKRFDIYSIRTHDLSIKPPADQHVYGGILISSFQTKEFGDTAFNLRIHDGPANDISYLQKTSLLKKLFDEGKIPYTDERDLSRLKLEATTYAEKLLRAAIELK